jgi:hypothetical protein
VIEPDECERLLAARDAALAEREEALAARDAALIERDAASAARDAAMIRQDAIPPSIQKIRKILEQQSDFSHSSMKFQDYLLRFIRSNSELGESVVEVGCYRGGLTT